MTPQTVACQASLSFTISQSLLKLMSIESVMPSNHLILCRPLSSCLQSFPVSGPYLMSQLFASGSQNIGTSASILLMNIQDWSLLGLTGLITLQSKGLSRVFSKTTVQKHQFCSAQPSLWSNSHIHNWLLEKSYLGLDEPLLAKDCLCFSIMLSRFVIAFLPRSQRLLISWLQSPSGVIWEPRYVTVSIVSPSICHDVMAWS